MKKLIISIGIIVLASFVFVLEANACCGCWGRAQYRCWVRPHHWWQDAEYDWVIKPEVLGDKLRIIANPAFIQEPRGDEYIVITGDPDNWQGDTWGMKWSEQGYVVDIPLKELPKNKRIRMNYVVTGRTYPNDWDWALFSWDNDNEWIGPGENGKLCLDFKIQYGRVIPID